MWKGIFAQRVVVDAGVPAGKYSDARAVNSGNHFVVINPFYAFTYEPNKKLEFSARVRYPSCDDRTPGQASEPGIRLIAAGQPPYRRVRREEIGVSRTEVPALTIAANPSQRIEITGHGREDWSLRFCAYGEGNSESEARDRLQEISLVRLGASFPE